MQFIFLGGMAHIQSMNNILGTCMFHLWTLHGFFSVKIILTSLISYSVLSLRNVVVSYTKAVLGSAGIRTLIIYVCIWCRCSSY